MTTRQRDAQFEADMDEFAKETEEVEAMQRLREQNAALEAENTALLAIDKAVLFETAQLAAAREVARLWPLCGCLTVERTADTDDVDNLMDSLNRLVEAFRSSQPTDDEILANAPTFVSSMRQADADLRDGRLNEIADVYSAETESKPSTTGRDE